MAQALPALHHPRSPKPDARARTGNPSLRDRAGPRHWSRRAARASSLHELRAVWTLSFAASRHRFSGRFPRLRNGWNVSPVRLSDSLKNEGAERGPPSFLLKEVPGRPHRVPRFSALPGAVVVWLLRLAAWVEPSRYLLEVVRDAAGERRALQIAVPHAASLRRFANRIAKPS